MARGEAKQWRDTVATANKSRVAALTRRQGTHKQTYCACLAKLTFTVSKGWPTINPAAPEAWNKLSINSNVARLGSEQNVHSFTDLP